MWRQEDQFKSVVVVQKRENLQGVSGMEMSHRYNFQGFTLLFYFIFWFIVIIIWAFGLTGNGSIKDDLGLFLGQ